jgi:MFS family permease
VVFGGVLTETLGWRSVFFTNVPVGIVVAVLTLHLIPAIARKHPSMRQLDLVGASTLMGGLVALLLAIQGTAQHGWISPYTLGIAAAGTALLASFVVSERRSRQPLIVPAVWRIRSLMSSAAVMLIATGILVGAFFLNTLYLQHVMGASPLETGLAFLPLTLIILAGAHAASHFLPRVGSRRIVVAGMLSAAGGASILAGAPSDPSYAISLLPGYLLLGLGVGMTFVAVSVAAMADVRDEIAGLASGLMTTAHEVGAAIGVSVLAAIASAAGDLVDGFDTGFLVAANVAAVVGVVCAFALPSVRPQPGTSHGLH